VPGEAAPPRGARPDQGRRRGRDETGAGHGHGPEGAAVEGGAPGEGGAQGDGEAQKKPKEPRRGIPVTDLLVHTHCARCHEIDKDQLMTRISFLRMAPEGWSQTVKRMVRLHGLQISPAEAKQIVRSLANSHGLTRDEAERCLYESERRVHWSEEQHDQDFRQACSPCHPLGRVLAQQRDDEEWQQLRNTHVAMFPLARGQMGGGPPPDEERNRPRGPGGAGGAPGAASRGGRGGAGSSTGAAGAQGSAAQGSLGQSGQAGRGQGQETSRGDRVLQSLAKSQPLFTPAWEAWSVNRREVPLAGTWTVFGHEIGRGDVLGTATLQRVEADEYEVTWNLRWADGSELERKGRGLLYAGYSWRGRSTDPGTDGATWREVLLLDADWQRLRGRCFTGNHDEVGLDLELHRHIGLPRVLALQNQFVLVPVKDHVLQVFGESLPETLRPADFHAGEGVTITKVERLSDRAAKLWLDVDASTPLGARTVAFADEPGRCAITLYDTVDYVRVRPVQGLARVGGTRHPMQIERFEAVAVHRGVDKKPYTDDDVDLMMVRPKWSLLEFAVREGDDDVRYVGKLDQVTGVFTPNVDGPNLQRKWQANNVGDVYVAADVELTVPVRPPEQAPAEAEPPAAKPEPSDQPDQPGEPAAPTPSTPAAAHVNGQPAQQPEPPAAPPGKPPAAAPAPAAPPAPVFAARAFHARAHLIVTVPLYARWNALEWSDQ
jgi:quinohemoprotein amine dehydrogenase